MNTPFGKGSGKERLETMKRRMDSAPNELWRHDGTITTYTLRSEKRTDMSPFVFIEYGFVFTDDKDNYPASRDGEYDTYTQVGIPVEIWESLIAAYLTAKETGRV